MNNDEFHKKLEEIDRNMAQENTLYYLGKYLNPDKNWDEEITPKQRIYKIRYANVNWEAVSDHIKGMDYQNFLKTPYWKAIAAHTKFKAGYRCQLCNRADYLVTHHRDYGIHGYEHANMHELIALCNGCHTKFHGLEEKAQYNKSDLNVSKIILIILSLLVVLFLFSTFDLFNAHPSASSSVHSLKKAKQKGREKSWPLS
jgi:hypothetical protein